MLILAAASISPTLLIGSLVVVWGTLLVTLGVTDSYRKKIKWQEATNKFGTLAILLGTITALIGAAVGDTNHTDQKILLLGIGFIALTDVLGLLAPRIHWRTKP
jgi:uncharacterized membrane protein